MIVLGIETTCDETACAVVRDGKEILSNIISSQSDIHSKFGGVFPELSCRYHVDLFIPTLEKALSEAKISSENIDLIAVAKGPGLIGALLIGLNAAKALSLAWNKPFIGVSHVDAHIYAAMMPPNPSIFPSLGLVISGGHTFTSKMKEVGSYELIGTTQDDAVGEAFDKVARLLNLPYPGGPAIEALAKEGNPSRFSFKAGNVKGRPLDFSFSGLKTSVLYTLKKKAQDEKSLETLFQEDRADIAAAFQETALKDIVMKAIDSAISYDCHAIYCGGGVSNNQRLKELFIELRSPVPVYYPAPQLTLDNAAMIAGLGNHLYQRQQQGDPLDLDPMRRAPFGTKLKNSRG